MIKSNSLMGLRGKSQEDILISPDFKRPFHKRTFTDSQLNSQENPIFAYHSNENSPMRQCSTTERIEVSPGSLKLDLLNVPDSELPGRIKTKNHSSSYVLKFDEDSQLPDHVSPRHRTVSEPNIPERHHTSESEKGSGVRQDSSPRPFSELHENEEESNRDQKM